MCDRSGEFGTDAFCVLPCDRDEECVSPLVCTYATGGHVRHCLASSARDHGVTEDCSSPCPFQASCCSGQCVYLDNDIHNCGRCGQGCPAETPVCMNRKCDAPSCYASCDDGGSCCGSSCCSVGETCCAVLGGPGYALRCTALADGGTCAPGCFTCMCAAPDTPIATPDGERAIASLRVGDLVYSLDHGAIAPVPIAWVQRTPVHHHRVQRVTLATGRVLEISAGHPTADGRTFATLVAGDELGGVAVARVESVEYAHPFTYDILPDSDTGTYVAAGALIGSTLATDAGAIENAESLRSPPATGE